MRVVLLSWMRPLQWRHNRRPQARRTSPPAHPMDPVVHLPVASVEWLRGVEVSTLAETPTLLNPPRRSAQWISRCYTLLAGMQHESNLDEYLQLGRKLHMLMPRLLFGPLAVHGDQARRAMIQRCQLFVRGDWERLFSAMPAPYTSEQRQAAQAERDTRRGYAAHLRNRHTTSGVTVRGMCG